MPEIILRLISMVNLLLKGISAVLIYLLVFPAIANANCIGVITAGGGQQFWIEVERGAHAAAKELGIKTYIRGPADEINTSGQRSMILSMQNYGCKVMVIAPNTSERKDDVEQLLSQGVPTIFIDRDIGGKRFSVVKTDNYRAGKTAGIELARALDGNGRVMIYRMDPEVVTTTLRENGFIEGARSGGLEIAGEIYLGTTIQSARKAAYKTLKQLTNIDGVFTPNESTSLALLATIQRHMKRSEITHIGIDSHPMMLKAIQEGHMYGLISQQPYKMGYMSIMQAHKVMQGEPYEKEIGIEVKLITKNVLPNLDRNQSQHD